MDVTIAKLHISVHLANARPVHGQPVAGHMERIVKQEQMIARVAQEREQARNSAALYGIH